MSEEFEAHRPHLRAVAYRMLGSTSEADDALQEAWLKLQRSDAEAVRNAGGWLTTLVARVCLDMLRRRKRRGEEPLEGVAARSVDPEQEAVLADSVGQALLVVLDQLSPAERLAFVLHDMFDIPFDEIGGIVGRTPEAARQLASRARRRVQGVEPPPADLRRRSEIVEAFLRASRAGDFSRLLALLHPEAVLRADSFVRSMGGADLVRGAQGVAETFAGRARAAVPAMLGGEPGLLWSLGGEPKVAFRFEFEGEQITGIELIGDPAEIGRLTTMPAP